MTDIDELIARVWPEAYRIAYGILRDRGLAEDAAQEACASIAAKCDSLKDAAAFRTWMYRIAANRAISIGRKRRSTALLSTIDEPLLDDDPTERLDIANALALLPLEQRALVVLHYYAGLSSGDIAGSTGLAASTVRFRLMLARQALRKALAVIDRPSNQQEGVSHA
jgi:RNA polymerase sigma-70 factor, ECF subfamily